MENFIPIALIVACILALTLIFLSARRIQKEGISIKSADRKHFVRSVEDVKRQQEEDQAVLSMATEGGKGSATHSRIGFGKVVQLGVEEALQRMEGELKARGFQTITTTDVSAVLRDSQLPPYKMITAFHKDLSSKAVYVEPSIGLLAANVIVRQDLGGDVHVEFNDPSLMAGHSGNQELVETASELKSRLLQSLQAL